MKEHVNPPGSNKDDVERLVQLANNLADLDESVDDAAFESCFEYQALQSRVTVHLQSGHDTTLRQAVEAMEPESEPYELLIDEIEVLSAITVPIGDVADATTSCLFVIPAIVSSIGGLTDGRLASSEQLATFTSALQASGVMPADSTVCVAPYLYRHSELAELVPCDIYGLSSSLLYQSGLTGADLFQRDWQRPELPDDMADAAIHEMVYLLGVCASKETPPLLVPWEDDPHAHLEDSPDHPLEKWHESAFPSFCAMVDAKGVSTDILLLTPAIFYQGLRNAMGFYSDMAVMDQLQTKLAKANVEPRGAVATLNFVPVDRPPEGIQVQVWSRLDETLLAADVRMFVRYEDPEQTMRILNHHLVHLGLAEVRLVGFSDDEDSRPSGSFATESPRGTRLH